MPEPFKTDIATHNLILTQSGAAATLIVSNINVTTEQLQILNALIAGNSGSTVEVKIKSSD